MIKIQTRRANEPITSKKVSKAGNMSLTQLDVDTENRKEKCNATRK